MKLAPFVVCPETLGPLEPREDGFWSPQAQKLYPSRRGLVFMTYPEKDRAMIEATMEEEREHQGIGDDVAVSNLAYLRTVAPRAVDFINVFRRFVEVSGRKPRALELGSGNGWVSWLLAEAGFETWMCDFEANTLMTGMNLVHDNLGEGRRFVTDARYAPIESGSMDIVVFKEFVHHVEDVEPLFREANRVLGTGGVLTMSEPIRSLSRTVREIRTPDPHEGHHMAWPDSYLRGVRRAGFEVVHQQPVYTDHGNTRWPMSWVKERAIAGIDDDHPGGDWVTKLQLRLFGGAQLMIVGCKDRVLPVAPRPAMSIIDPDKALADGEPPAAYDQFPVVLREAAEGLDSTAAREVPIRNPVK